MTETLCKLYLELAEVVPEDCKSSRELKLEEQVREVKHSEFMRARAEFTSVVQSQRTLLNLFRYLKDEKPDELEHSFGTQGVKLLDDALQDVYQDAATV